MRQFFDLVRFSTATVGTGSITVGSATQGCRTPAQALIADGTQVSYSIFDGINFETGSGTTGGGGTTLSRDTVFISSNANAKIHLTGFAQVGFDFLAEDLGAIGTIASQDANAVAITGGAISGVTLSGGMITAIGIGLGLGTLAFLSAAPAANLAASGAGGVIGNLPVGNLNSGTGATGTTFWCGDGTWKSVGSASLANPTGLIGLTVSNGTAITAPRSDGTHAIDQSIAPTWTGLHIFNAGVQVGPATATNNIPGAFLPFVSNVPFNYAPTNTSGGTANHYLSMQLAAASNSAGFNANLFVDTGVPSTSTVTYNSIYGIYSINQYNGTGNVTDQVVGAQFAANNGSVSANILILEGCAFTVSNQSTGSVGTAYGADSVVANFSTGAITQSYALKSNTIQSNAGGTWTNAVGLWITLSNLGTMTNFVGLNVVPTSGAATNNTHILLGTATPQAGNYNIYANDNYPTFLGGGIHIGTTITTGDIAGATVIANNVMNYAPTNTAASTAVINKLATTQPSAVSNSASTFYGTYFDLNIPSSSTVTYGTLFGTISIVKNFGSGTVNLIEASNFAVSHNSATGTINNAEGMNGSVLNASTGTITNAFAGIFALQNSSTGTISTGYGFRLTILNSGTFTACTGILISMTNTLTMGNFVGLNVSASTATNNTHVLLGTVTPPSGNYAIYSSGSYATYLGGAVQMANYGAGTATFDASGNITSVSDERVKTFKRPFKRGISDLLKIGHDEGGIFVRSLVFKYRPDNAFGLETEHEYAGYFAQDVQRGIPEAVGIGPDGHLSLSDRPILAAAVNGLIELETRIASLENRN